MANRCTFDASDSVSHDIASTSERPITKQKQTQQCDTVRTTGALRVAICQAMI